MNDACRAFSHGLEHTVVSSSDSLRSGTDWHSSQSSGLIRTLSTYELESHDDNAEKLDLPLLLCMESYTSMSSTTLKRLWAFAFEDRDFHSTLIHDRWMGRSLRALSVPPPGAL
ncbi:hypothetical protein VTN02DRAFT_5212 [Thermoascus thermophilus]